MVLCSPILQQVLVVSAASDGLARHAPPGVGGEVELVRLVQGLDNEEQRGGHP